MKQVKFTKKYWKELILDVAGIMYLRCGWNWSIYSEYIERCKKQEMLDLLTHIQLVYSKFALHFHWLMMIVLGRLIERLTNLTPCVDELEDLVNPSNLPTRSLDTIEKINKIKTKEK